MSKVRVTSRIENLLNTGNYQNVKLISEITLEEDNVSNVTGASKDLQETARNLVLQDLAEQKKAIDQANEELFSFSS